MCFPAGSRSRTSVLAEAPLQIFPYWFSGSRSLEDLAVLDAAPGARAPCSQPGTVLASLLGWGRVGVSG